MVWLVAWWIRLGPKYKTRNESSRYYRLIESSLNPYTIMYLVCWDNIPKTLHVLVFAVMLTASYSICTRASLTRQFGMHLYFKDYEYLFTHTAMCHIKYLYRYQVQTYLMTAVSCINNSYKG